MSFDWSLYIQLADELMNHQRNPILREAYLRSAISRSYYGIYCISRNLLIKRGVKIDKTRSAHTQVREEYIYSKNKLERKIGNNLSRLWDFRKDADYEDPIVGVNDAQLAYKLANKALYQLKRIGAV